ncbi:MAG: hypothetical protein ABIK28_16470, partial [Planctomycetota bacterium]
MVQISNFKKTCSQARGRLPFLVILALLCSFGSTHLALATQGVPPPSLSTYADFYVSGSAGKDSNPGTFQ